jgi:beta-galactosidase
VPAVTRHRFGDGAAWYAATRLDVEGVRRLVGRLAADTGVHVLRPPGPGVELVRRTGDDRSYLFVLNHTDEDVILPWHGTDLLTGTTHEEAFRLPAGGAVVLREA